MCIEKGECIFTRVYGSDYRTTNYASISVHVHVHDVHVHVHDVHVHVHVCLCRLLQLLKDQ